ELNGNAWTPLGTFSSTYYGSPAVYSLAVYNGDLIAAGIFDHADGDSTGGVARWDGSTWRPMATNAPVPQVNALAVHGTRLIAGGALTNFDGVGQWDGTTWSAVGAGLQQGPPDNFPATVTGLQVVGDKLYAVGGIYNSGATTFTGLPQW